MKKKSQFGIDWGNLGSKAYSGTAEFGKDLTYVTTVIACIFSLFLFIFGIFLTFRKPEYTMAATMTMTKSGAPDESMNYQNSGTIISTGQCNGQTLNLANSGMTLYSGGESQQVFLKPGSCDQAQLHEDNTKWLGIIFMIVSLLIIAFSFVKLFFVKKYKGVAAASGVLDVVSMFRR